MKILSGGKNCNKLFLRMIHAIHFNMKINVWLIYKSKPYEFSRTDEKGRHSNQKRIKYTIIFFAYRNQI